MNIEKKAYGVGDRSYQAAGGLSGLINLVDAFYGYMDVLPEAKAIRVMHRSDLTESSLKLAYFLSGWLGGPRLYSEHFGSIAIPKAHRHLRIGHEEADSWMLCMEKAVEEQPYNEEFKTYLIKQLRVPAERILMVCDQNSGN
ncbi:group II truncated hemoglobin [Vibrio sp.]|nr:group II truncated hemoglobin [Vibrio sp.]